MISPKRNNRIPLLKEDIYLVVEGEVDELFINRIISFLPCKYNVRVRVANGNGNIPIHVNILKKIYSYSKIFVLYDLDATQTVGDLKRYLKNKEVYMNEDSIFFVNPCIEYLISLCKEYNEEKYTYKRDYQFYMKKYFYINDYAGHIPQVENIVEQIEHKDYLLFIENISKASKKDIDLPSTNILDFLDIVKE